MATEIVEIVIRDRGARATSAAISGVGKSAASVTKIVTGLVAVLGTLIAAKGLGGVAKSAVQAAAGFEQYGVRLRALLGSQQEANTALDNFVTLSARTPFAVGQIVEGATSLAAAALGNRQRLEELTQTAANLAAVTGLSFQEAAGNLARSLTAGIGAADLFRERGVRALIESIEGIPDATKLSGQELDRAFSNIFGVNGTFGQAAENLSATLGGALSNVGDAASVLEVALGNALSGPVINAARDVIIPFLTDLRDLVVENSDEIASFARDSLQLAIQFFGLLTEAALETIKALNRLRAIGNVFQGVIGEVQIESINRRLEVLNGNLAAAEASGDTELAALLRSRINETTGDLKRLRSTVDDLAEENFKASIEADKFDKSLESIQERARALTSGTFQIAVAPPESATADVDLSGVSGTVSTLTAEQIAERERAAKQLLAITRDLRFTEAEALGEREASLFLIDEQIAKVKELVAITGDEAQGQAIINDLLARRAAIEAENSFGGQFASNISASLQQGISEGIRTGQLSSQAFADSFGEAAQTKLDEGLQKSFESLEQGMTETFNGIANSLSGIFGPAFSGLGSVLGDVMSGVFQFVALQAVSALFGGGGNSISSSSAGNVASAVTSTEAVRGIVAGPQEIAIAQVDRAISDSIEPLIAEARIQTSLQRNMLTALQAGVATTSTDESALAFTTPVSGA